MVKNLIYHNDGLFAMCDLLGFSEYINNNEAMEVYNTVINDLIARARFQNKMDYSLV
jgi:hypothetical protein